MNIYSKPVASKIKVAYTIGKIFIILALLGVIVYGLVRYDIVPNMHQFEFIDLIVTGSLAVIAILILIIAKAKDKRDNIVYDGQSIKFRTNNKVNAEYVLKDIEQLVPYRSEPGIAYGMANALAFRLDKTSAWTSITEDYYLIKRKKSNISSLQLMKDILADYAQIKTQRAIKEINDHKGVRFTYLIIQDKSMNNIDVRDLNFKKFEYQIMNSNPMKDNSNYADFIPNSLVVTKDTLFVNKVAIASVKENDYIKIRNNFNQLSTEYYIYDIVDFYNKKGKLILSIDLALVVNSEFFKSMVKSVFHVENNL